MKTKLNGAEIIASGRLELMLSFLISGLMKLLATGKSKENNFRKALGIITELSEKKLPEACLDMLLLKLIEIKAIASGYSEDPDGDLEILHGIEEKLENNLYIDYRQASDEEIVEYYEYVFEKNTEIKTDLMLEEGLENMATKI